MRKLLLGVIPFLAIPALAQVAAAPTFSPAGGTYATSVTVTISTVTSGANVYCTTDGTSPTLISPQITAPVVITANTSYTCMAALPVVQQNNAQNNDPSASGTFWKQAACITSPTWSATTAYAAGAFVSYSGQQYQATIANTNHTPAKVSTFWTYLDCAVDNPGGHGQPTNIIHTSGNASPSLSGASMKFSETSQPNLQTNILWSIHGPLFGGGGSNAATHYLSDFYLQPGPTDGGNIGSFETDTFHFDTASGIRYMYGMQYCVLGSNCPGNVTGLDIVGNSNVPWTYTGISSPKPTVGQWLHYQVLMHRVPAEETSLPCVATGNWPYLYWDHIVLNGIDYHTGNNGTNGWKYCANANPFNLVVGFQFQIDIPSKSSATPGSYYIDNANFLATTDYSSNTAASYFITSSGGGPTTMFGTRTNFGGIITHFFDKIKQFILQP